MEGEVKNPVEEYIRDSEPTSFLDLFEANKENVDLRTDLIIDEIVIINKLKVFDLFIEQKLGFNLYDKFLENYLRLKISNDRLSRAEFVDINRKDRFEQNLKKFGEFANISKIKE